MTSSDGASPRNIVYRLWNGVLPDPVCQTVIDTFDESTFYDAVVQRSTGESANDPTVRKATNMFIEPGHWTGALITHFAHQANLLWRYDLAGLGTLSIVRYDSSGHFNWHVDVLSYDRTDYAALGDGLERKLSVTINLSTPDDYEGGDLEFLNGVGQLLTQPELRERGSVVVFPSTVGHRVTPITSGVRYALVGWMVGPPLR
jgi:PKHD-type hydroxylase